VTKTFVVLNPAAGRCDAAIVRAALEEHLGGAKWTYQVHETSPGENIADTVRGILNQDLDVCVAAGGDGTVAGVAAALVGTETPLGILPLGTGNALAREMGVPLRLDSALALLVGPHTTRAIDAIHLGERFFFLAVGVGISARMMHETPSGAKRRLGRVSYLYTGLRRLSGLQLVQFDISADGQVSRERASEVNLANAGIVGDPRLRWGPQVRLDDGRLNVCIVRARTFVDYVRLVWSALLGRQRRDPHLRYLTAERSVAVQSDPAQPVQADGEYIGQTPVVVQFMPAAVRLIVPPMPQHTRGDGEMVIRPGEP
jgi:YegS/Rv2252/BmrU family lipid kinase